MYSANDTAHSSNCPTLDYYLLWKTKKRKGSSIKSESSRAEPHRGSTAIVKPSDADAKTSCCPFNSSVSSSLNQTPSVICQCAGSVISVCCNINNEETCLSPCLTVSLSVICLFFCVFFCLVVWLTDSLIFCNHWFRSFYSCTDCFINLSLRTPCQSTDLASTRTGSSSSWAARSSRRAPVSSI